MSESSIQDVLNNRVVNSEPRSYSGLSGVGNKCYRALQYAHYWAFKDSYSARVERLFNVGHAAEEIMINDLQSQGLTVHSDQKEIIGFAGHWKGHIDGIIDDDFLWEAKTHNDKSFSDLKKKRVQESKPLHYSQVTAYMGYLGLPQALYMAINKNNSEYYLEYVDFDEDHFKEIKVKTADIITTDVLFKRIGTGRPSWFECKFCNASDVCFGLKKPETNCRTCQHVNVLDKGQWQCGKNDAILSVDEQRAGCSDYELSEMLKN